MVGTSRQRTYYFSTHGCSWGSRGSFEAGADLEEDAVLVAAARALLSKKLAIPNCEASSACAYVARVNVWRVQPIVQNT